MQQFKQLTQLPTLTFLLATTTSASETLQKACNTGKSCFELGVQYYDKQNYPNRPLTHWLNSGIRLYDE